MSWHGMALQTRYFQPLNKVCWKLMKKNSYVDFNSLKRIMKVLSSENNINYKNCTSEYVTTI